MAKSPAFTPPMNELPSEKDPMIIKVDRNKVDWGARRSAQPALDQSGVPAVKHVGSGS